MGLGDAERVMGPQSPNFERLDGKFEVIDWRGWRGEVEDIIDLAGHFERVRDIAADELEPGIAEQMNDVFGRAGDQIIDRNDFVTLREESIAEMRADEARAAGDECSHEWI